MSLFNRNDKEEMLKPAGKLYGKYFGLPDEFYLAFDSNGKFFRNSHLWEGATPYAKQAGWESMSSSELAEYLKHYSFVDPKVKNANTSETLKPIGKMKGEINDRFEAFYLAVDKSGKLYRNHDMDYSGNPYQKSHRWKETTREEFENYKKHLHMISLKQFSVRK